MTAPVKNFEPLAYHLEQAFRLLGIGRNTGFLLLKTGDLESYRVGRRRYITRKALETFIANQQKKVA